MLSLTTIRKPSSFISLFPSLVQGAGVCKHTTANKQTLHVEIWPRLSFASLRSKWEQIVIYPKSIDYQERRTRKYEVFCLPKTNVGSVIPHYCVIIESRENAREWQEIQFDVGVLDRTQETLLSVMVAKFIFKVAYSRSRLIFQFLFITSSSLRRR